jgi:hypothetical protein
LYEISTERQIWEIKRRFFLLFAGFTTAHRKRGRKRNRQTNLKPPTGEQNEITYMCTLLKWMAIHSTMSAKKYKIEQNLSLKGNLMCQ